MVDVNTVLGYENAQAAGDLAGARPYPAGLDLDRHRAQEGVPLVAGVLAGGVGQLSGEGVGDLGEGGVVLGADHHHEGVGDDGAPPDVDGPVDVHLAGEAPADLDRSEAGPEDAREGALDGLLQPLLEPLQPHGPPTIPVVGGPVPASGDPSPAPDQAMMGA